MEQPIILVKVAYGFSCFYGEKGKENNTYFIDVVIIENVEVRLIENG